MTEFSFFSPGANSHAQYVLICLGGRIDQAHHYNRGHIALIETTVLSDAVSQAVKMTNENETLIVVTADHSHTLSIGGYSKRGASITGETAVKLKRL